MRAGARLWIALGVLLIVAAAFVWSRACGHDDGKRHPHPTLRGLDVNAFRSALAARLRRATELAARPNSAPATSRAARTDKWPMLGKGAVPNAGTDLIEPQCTIGPRELCTLLDGLVRGCDAGGARDLPRGWPIPRRHAATRGNHRNVFHAGMPHWKPSGMRTRRRAQIGVEARL